MAQSTDLDGVRLDAGARAGAGGGVGLGIQRLRDVHAGAVPLEAPPVVAAHQGAIAVDAPLRHGRQPAHATRLLSPHRRSPTSQILICGSPSRRRPWIRQEEHHVTVTRRSSPEHDVLAPSQTSQHMATLKGWHTCADTCPQSTSTAPHHLAKVPAASPAGRTRKVPVACLWPGRWHHCRRCRYLVTEHAGTSCMEGGPTCLCI